MSCRSISLVLVCATWANADVTSVEYTGWMALPAQAHDQDGTLFDVGGLSGLAWHADGSWTAVLDNSDKMLRFTVDFGDCGAIEGVDVLGGVTLDFGGDWEDLDVTLDGGVRLVDEAGQRLVQVDGRTGSVLDEITLPAPYETRRPNLGCESLTLDAGGTLYTANEEALAGDGARATPQHGTWVRLLTAAAGAPLQDGLQFALHVEPMHGPYIPFTQDGQSGLVALVSLPTGELLALERSLAAAGDLFLSRLYELDLHPASDVAGLDTLDGTSYEPVQKTLRYSGGHQNLEGLGSGPALADGRRVLLGVVDDGDPLSQSRLVSFVVTTVDTCPGDIDGDGAVTVSDLVSLLGAWGRCPAPCMADLDADGVVDTNDLLSLLAGWGACR